MDNRKQMFQATCDKCGNECEVPFRPSGGKPVLCSECFGKKGFGNKGSKFQKRSGDRKRRFGDRSSRSGDRQMHQAVCDKCGKECEVPFKPTAGKPIYCNDCFGKNIDRKERHGGRDRQRSGGNDQVAQQLSALSGKLDRILSLLDPRTPKKESPSKETTFKSSVIVLGWFLYLIKLKIML